MKNVLTLQMQVDNERYSTLINTCNICKFFNTYKTSSALKDPIDPYTLFQSPKYKLKYIE